MDKIVFLDGLRGLAAMMVVMMHAGYARPHNIGASAVDIFFVLSAFLLTLIFEKKAKDLFAKDASYKQWGWTLADYFTRRLLRVYPLFALVALLFAVLPASERTRSLWMKQPDNYDLLGVWTFRHDSHPGILWTLPIEISYYFCIPLLVVVVLKLGNFAWLAGITGYAVIFYNGFCQWSLRKQHGLKLAHFPTFLCGSLAAMAYSRINEQKIKRNFVFKTWHTVVLRVLEVAFLALLLSQLFDGLLFDWIAANPAPVTNHFISFPVTVLIVCEMLHPGPISSVFESPLLRYAGKVSFSMYLLHVLVIYLPLLDHQSYFNRLFLIWTMVFLISTVSYHAIESPCQVLAGRIGKWIKAKSMAPLPPYENLEVGAAKHASQEDATLASAC